MSLMYTKIRIHFQPGTGHSHQQALAGGDLILPVFSL